MSSLDDYDSLASAQFLVDRKKRPFQASYMTFLTSVLLGPPVIAILASTGVLCQAFIRLKGAILPSQKLKLPAEIVYDMNQQLKDSPPLPKGQRKYDLVLLGATGFTGTLGLEYLARNYCNSEIKLAIAGRNEEKLREVIEKVKVVVDGWNGNIDIIKCDSSNFKEVYDLCAQTNVIVSTAGPFAKIGTSIVAACAYTGTDYCDITGETEWVKENILLFGDLAKESGARIVSLCGHDSIPWDLSVHTLAKLLNEKGENLAKVTFMDEIQGGPSGGTLATMIHAIEGGSNVDQAIPPARTKHNPLMLSADNKTVSPFKTKNQSPLLFPVKAFGSWIAPFVMSVINFDAVRRSAALRTCGNGSLVYVEGMHCPDFKTSVVHTIGLFTGVALLLVNPLRNLLMNYGTIPKPGEGPSLKTMKNGFLRVTGYGEGDKGGRVNSVMYFDVDAGYRDTSRMLMESGLTLVLNGKDLKCGGGVMTPGYALGDHLLNRLVKTGTRFATKIVK